MLSPTFHTGRMFKAIEKDDLFLSIFVYSNLNEMKFHWRWTRECVYVCNKMADKQLIDRQATRRWLLSEIASHNFIPLLLKMEEKQCLNSSTYNCLLSLQVNSFIIICSFIFIFHYFRYMLFLSAIDFILMQEFVSIFFLSLSRFQRIT